MFGGTAENVGGGKGQDELQLNCTDLALGEVLLGLVDEVVGLKERMGSAVLI